jgi:phosphate/sulfate permease
MTEKLQAIRKISNRLATALAVLVFVMICGAFFAASSSGGSLITAPVAAFAAGVIGGFVGLQRRLKIMSEDDLTLLANSWVYVCLSPLVGGILAVVLYVLFISTLISGELFPNFVPDMPRSAPEPPKFIPDTLKFILDTKEHSPAAHKGFAEIFAVHGQSVDYAKMMFWSFFAGFSERFVTDIISKFENDPGSGGQSGT